MLDIDNEALLPEIKMISHCISALEFQIDFMLKSCRFDFMSPEIYDLTYELKEKIQALRLEYAQNIKFSHSFT